MGVDDEIVVGGFAQLANAETVLGSGGHKPHLRSLEGAYGPEFLNKSRSCISPPNELINEKRGRKGAQAPCAGVHSVLSTTGLKRALPRSSAMHYAK